MNPGHHRTTFALAVAAACALGLPGCRRDSDAEAAPGEFARLMNLGKAYLENRDSAKAIEALSGALEHRPRSAPALRNLARAKFLAGDFAAVVETLARAKKVEPDSAATEYLTGLAYVRQSKFEEAIPHLQRAVQLDPHTAALRYQLAGAYQAAEQHDKAEEQLLETLRLDPLHASAHFKLGAYARSDGDSEEFQRRTREFARLRALFGDETRSVDALEQCVHTRPEAPPTAATGPARPAPIAVRFADATAEMFPDGTIEAVAACVIDVHPDGRAIVFTVDPSGATALVSLSGPGTFQREPAGIQAPDNLNAFSCTAGDFHNDLPQGADFDHEIHARNDVLILGREGTTLLKRTREVDQPRFLDVTEPAGLTGLVAQHATWVDYEHDGDLDLWLATNGGPQLWQNNGDATFKPVTAEVGITNNTPTVATSAAELHNDVAVDLIAAHGDQPTRIWKNQRAGRFAAAPEPPGPWPPAQIILANDLTNDGYVDLALIASNEVVVVLNRETYRPRIDLSQLTVNAARLLDFDNDGWLDFIAAGSKRDSSDGTLRIWRNTAAKRPGDVRWEERTAETGLEAVTLPVIDHLVPGDFDADGDTDLLLIADNQLRILRNDGGDTHNQLKLDLATVKTNPSAFGTHVELRRGQALIARSVTTPLVEIGTANLDILDTVQTVWTNGVVDNQIDLQIGATPLTIREKVVATGSCPFLYAWDGTRFRFVTDLLGNSPVGLPLSRDVMLPADPDEIVRIGPAETFPPLNGAYTVQVTDEFREILYLDQVKLIAVDHPPGVEVHPTDKIMFPPFPPSEVHALSSSITAIRAVGDDGIDRTNALREIDGQFAPPGPALPPPYRGMCQPLALTLDFGKMLRRAERPAPVLALTGWLQYGDASTNIAMSQDDSLTIIPPTLEAELPDGKWTALDAAVGMPAGKTKTILVDLTDKLPEGTRRLRLITTFEIRWDRIALLDRVPLPSAHVYDVPPTRADLQWRGFSELKARAPGHPTTPDHQTVSDRPPWRTVLDGWCTRYGDVLPLVRERDDQLVIQNAGDAVTIGFDASLLPPVPAGLMRTFFLYSVGWDKDGDHNVTDGTTVEPLPVDITAASADDRGPPWWLQYNTRLVPKNKFAADNAH